MKAIKDVLRAKLSDAEYHRMAEITSDWKVIPFEYCPDFNGFQTSDEWDSTHVDVDIDDLDLLFRSCEILNESATTVMAPLREDSSETVTLEFTFSDGTSRDDLDVGRRFLGLLQHSPGYTVKAREHLETLDIAVSFSFRGDFEYMRQRDDINLLLESARHARHGQSFKGHRL